MVFSLSCLGVSGSAGGSYSRTSNSRPMDQRRQDAIHEGIGRTVRGRWRGAHPFCRLNVRGRNQLVCTVPDQLVRAFGRGFEVKLECQDGLTEAKRLILADAAPRQLDGAVRQIEGLAVPV